MDQALTIIDAAVHSVGTAMFFVGLSIGIMIGQLLPHRSHSR